MNKAGLANPSKHIKSEKGEKSERDKARHGRSSMPFHRRPGQADALFQQNIDIMMQRLPPDQLSNIKVSANNQNIPQLPVRGSNNIENIDSPHSAAPSPLNISQIQPSTASQNGDPTMPTLSPHPPSKTTDQDLNASGSLQGELMDSGAGMQSSRPGVGGSTAGPIGTSAGGTGMAAALPTTDNFACQIQQTIKSENSLPVTLHGLTNGLDSIKVEGVNSWLDSQKERRNASQGIKRPVLPTQDYHDDEEELLIKALYNFDSIHSL